jgi:hypothetical protein
MRSFYSHRFPTNFSYGGGLQRGADLPPPGRVWVTEIGEAEAWADLTRAAPPALGLRLERVGGATLLLWPDFDDILFNRVLGLGLVAPADAEQVAAIVEHYRAAGVRRFAVHLSALAEPAALPEWLASHGLVRGDAWAKLYRRPVRDLDHPTTLRVEEIGSEDADAFATVACAAYETPDLLLPWLRAAVGRLGWRHYLAFDGERPVAVAALFVRAGIGWLGLAGTRPAERGRGAQGALIARRVRDAAALGCQWVVSEAEEETPDRPSPSYRNLARAGFTLAGARPNYVGRPRPVPPATAA